MTIHKKKYEKIKDTAKNYPGGGVICTEIILLLYIFKSMMGFRWPGIYVMTNHLITSRDGFVPRTLVSTILELIVGDRIYKYQFWYFWILFISFLFIFYIITVTVREVIWKENILFLLIIASYVISPYPKYYIHEAGYFEQYGYLLLALLIEISLRGSIKKTCVSASVFSFIAVLVSETNLFLIVPCLFTIGFLDILELEKVKINRIAGYAAAFIPSLIYSLLSFCIRVPKQKMDLISEICNQKANFPLRQDVFTYFWDDRSNADSWGRALHAIPINCIIVPLLLVIVITILLYHANKKRAAAAYFVMSVLIGLFNYSIVIVAWDLHRYYWCIYMQIFILTIYIVLRYLKNHVLEKHEWCYLVLMILAYIGMGGFEFDLFDGAHYLRTMQEMKDVLLNYGTPL